MRPSSNDAWLDGRTLDTLRREAGAELGRILDFWLRRSPDEQNGGFHGAILNDLTVVPDAPRGLVLNSRILWTFSRAYRFEARREYLEMADRAWDNLRDRFHDRRYGGYFFLVDAQGRPLSTQKHLYAQAFVLYAVSEYVRATGRRERLPLLQELIDVVERGLDSVHGGYMEAYTREWGPAEDMRLSDIDLNEKKSMNTHLHILEAYTNVLRVWRTPAVEMKLRDVLGLMLGRILDARTGHFRLFFDDDWTVKSDLISFGHDVEGSWLLVEAADEIGDAVLSAKARTACVTMVDAVMRDGMAQDGAICWEAGPAGRLDDDRHWWPQAEGLVGLLNAYELTADRRYLEALQRLWAYIQSHVVDHEHGEWFWKVNRDGIPDLSLPKVNEWKCPYHNSRACFEIIDRLSVSVAARGGPGGHE